MNDMEFLRSMVKIAINQTFVLTIYVDYFCGLFLPKRAGDV